MRSVRLFFPRWSQAVLETRVVADTRPDGGTYRTDPHASQAWRALYMAALFETDEALVGQRIAEAKKALVARARELFHTKGEHQQERSAIENTLQSLYALERYMVHPVIPDALKNKAEEGALACPIS